MQERTFHIVTFGCQMNVNDSGWLSRTLTTRGFSEAPLADAEVVIVNTCSVREKPELKVRSALGRIRRETGDNPRVLVGVTGCVAQQLGTKLYAYSPQVRLVAGGDGFGQVPDTIETLLRQPGTRRCLTEFTADFQERVEEGELPSDPCAYVNIMQGCDNFCTYCIVPYTRGRQKSRAHGMVLEDCRRLTERGVPEITLLGQNVNAYGMDRTGDGTSFASLVRMVAALPGLRRLRYVSPHPKDMTAEDTALFGELDALCPRLHLPMQAGSDEVLRRMNRRYTGEDFLRLVENLRKARPDIALSTDLIVGFPGETEEQFRETLDLVRACGYVSSFSFCYSDRPGTRASLYADKIPSEVQLDRLSRLQALQDEMTADWLASRVGGTTEILFEQPSPRQDEGAAPGLVSWQGRDPYGAPVHTLLKEEEARAGLLLPVRIVRSLRHSLIAEPLGEEGKEDGRNGEQA